jgi:nucleotide-binding universal stress UspA family protein
MNVRSPRSHDDGPRRRESLRDSPPDIRTTGAARVPRASAEERRERSGDKAEGGAVMIHKILVLLDGSAAAEAVLPRIVMLAPALAAEVVLPRVVRAHVFPGVNAIEAQMHVVCEAEEYLGLMAEQLRLWGLSVRTVVRYGDPVLEILDHIRFTRVSLVGMASCARTGVCRLVLGGVAAAVLRHAGAPVLLLRPRSGSRSGRSLDNRSGEVTGQTLEPRGRG